ncbi:MAG TPA: hypothetical protein VMO47_18455, partial [Rhodothermales bacterium]|nr:hypothetical protein [Rhodothermales bacterium]
GVMYDVTAWNLLMYYGLDALELDQDLPARGVSPYQKDLARWAEPAVSKVGYIVDGHDDASLTLAARLMEKGVWVRAAEKPFELDGQSFARGSIVVQNTDNRDCGASISEVMKPGHTDRVPPGCDLHAMLSSVASELSLSVHSVGTGQGPGDLPDLGGSHFKLLLRPQIALLARDHVSSYSFGSIWHAIDTKLGIRHSHLGAEWKWSAPDFRRYSVVVLPSTSGSWDASHLKSLKPWVESGGTLIAIGSSAHQLASDTSGLSKVRLLRDVLDKLDDYEMAVHRDWQAREKTIPSTSAVFSHTPGQEGPVTWDSTYSRPDTVAATREDKWRRLFMPAGATLVAARTNPEHWLMFGTGESIAPLLNGSRVLMATSEIESAARVGLFEPRAGAPAQRVGWSSVPAGHDVFVRQSGLLWPEATQRMTNAPVVTREKLGKGQVILIGFEPNFRGTTAETRRVLFNAMVLGPGMGTEGVVTP